MFEGWRIKVKYIRLKNGRIVSQFKTVRTSEIVKKADTIKELCDEFVAVVNDNPQQHQFMTPFDYYMRSLNPKDVSLYGAIWTDKGLIYIAKMNESGVLELL